MALKGTLRDFALPDIFQLIGMQRKTGLLTLESERETVTVVFENGMVVHADSSVRRLDDLLGNLLVRQGKLKKESLEEALARQRVSMQRLGYILTSQGYILSNDLKEALSAQMQQIVFRIFRWKQGTYHFDPSSTVDYDRENVIPMSADHILMEGIRRVDEWPIIEKRIPSLDMVFRPLVPKSQIKVGQARSGEDLSLGGALEEGNASGGRASNSQSELVLSDTEAKIFGMLDGKTSLATIVDMTGLSDFDVCRILFDFIDRHLAAPAGQQQQQGARSAAAAVVAPAPRAAAPGVALPALLVIALAALVGLFLSLRGSPFRVPGVASDFQAERANLRRSVSLGRMQRVDAALRVHYLITGDFPATLDDLVNARPPLLGVEDLRDADDRPFAYRVTPELIQLSAVSESGEPYLTFVHQPGF
jgi:hypothetical protein